MALEFRPPEWLLQEYVNRRRPQDEVADQLDKISQQQMAQRQQQSTIQLAQEAKDIELAKLASSGGTNATDTLNAIRRSRGLPPISTVQPTPASQPVQQQPTGQPIPMDANNNPIGGPQQGPQLPGVGLGMAAQKTPASGMGAPSPIIDHWNSFASGSPSPQPSKPTPPDLGSDPALEEFNAIGSRAYIQKYGTEGLAKVKTALDIQKGLQDKTKGPLKTVTKEQAISNGVFDPSKEIIVDPSQATTAETKQERLGSSFRKELTSSDPYKKLVASKTAAENIEKAVNDPGAYGDLGMLFDYMKALDPISVVREGEQEMFKKTGSFTQSMANTMNKIVNGQTVTPEQRKEVLKYAKNRLRTAHDQYKNHSEPTLRQSKRLGVDPLEVDPFYGQSFDAPEQTGQVKSFLKPGEEDAYAAYKASILKGGKQ